MIVIGVDPHKQTHTAAVVDGRSGELVGERTVRARRRGHEQLLGWARALAVERLWALEDCRHVSLSLERFLLARGERVVRVPPRLMGASRKGVRTTGKSDRIDALAVARAGLREPGLPQAFLAGGSVRSSCSSTTTMISSLSGRGSRAGCAGTCTISNRI